jgi:8-oxo-dGTP diphosphatase
MYTKEYIPPTLTVDSVVFQVTDGLLEVLLINRTTDPFAGWYALPGGYNAAGETTVDALGRVLDRKAGLKISSLGFIEQLYTFDTVARDPRGHAVSVTYMGVGRDISLQPGKHGEHPQFFPVTNLPKLAYDHLKIIEYAHQRLKSKLDYTNAAFALLPEKFTLSQLQSVYEAVLVKELDKRNFRKKFLSFDLLQETREMYREGAHRPARLYQFTEHTLHHLTNSFD